MHSIECPASSLSIIKLSVDTSRSAYRWLHKWRALTASMTSRWRHREMAQWVVCWSSSTLVCPLNLSLWGRFTLSRDVRRIHHLWTEIRRHQVEDSRTIRRLFLWKSTTWFPSWKNNVAYMVPWHAVGIPWPTWYRLFHESLRAFYVNFP